MEVRCGIDLVSVERMARLDRELDREGLARIFGEEELAHSRALRFPARFLAERFAAKEACLKLFPRETAAGDLGVEDVVVTNGGGRARVVPGDRLRRAMDRHGVAEISIAMSSCRTEACAIAVAAGTAASGTAASGTAASGTVAPGSPAEELSRAAEAVRRLPPSPAGRFALRFLPIRRKVVLANMRRVFGDRLDAAGYRALAEAFYSHMGSFLLETLAYTFQSPERIARRVQVENMEIPLRAAEAGRGLLILTGHFGSWETACAAGILQFPQYRGRFHFLRRPITNRWIEGMVLRRFRRAGLGILPKKGSLLRILDLLGRNDALVFIMDQHASVPKDGLPVEFFGERAGTFRSLALIARDSGAPVIPAHGWREPDGSHRLRFEEALPWTPHPDPAEEIRLNTRAYNRVLERMVLSRPEQWFWMHKRWKLGTAPLFSSKK